MKDARGRWRLEDDGTRIALLEASGVDIGGKSRGGAFDALLEEYGACFDTDTRTIYSPPLLESELGGCGVRFIGLLLRLQDLALLAPQVVRSTFREDALAAIHGNFDGVANVMESVPLSSELDGQEADVIVRAPTAAPMAIFLATSEERALQALVTKMEAEKYRQIPGSVVLMVERAKQNPLRESTYGLALARLDAVVAFRGGAERDTMMRLNNLAGTQYGLEFPRFPSLPS